MKNSDIEWTDHTFNPWIGCTKVSPGCAHCYAEAFDKRWTKGEHWGKGAPRQRTSASYWMQPIRWNRDAAAGFFRRCTVCGHREFRKWDNTLPPGGMSCCSNPECTALPETEADVVRPRVFCASLADWLDEECPIDVLADLLDLIRRTPNLDWLLLTKRPKNWWARIELVFRRITIDCNDEDRKKFVEYANWLAAWLDNEAPANIWIGTSIEDQQRADERIPELLKIPANVRFLSCEPLLGPLDLDFGNPKWRTVESYHAYIHWVICGGESGPNARPMNPDWARSLRDQCQHACIAFFFKQWGEWREPDTFKEEKNHVWVSRGGRRISAHEFATTDALDHDGARMMIRAGKKAAGRLLDGREWNEMPK